MFQTLEKYYRTMHKNAAVLTAVCLLLCLSFNYTFPLHRGTTKSSVFGNHTHIRKCAKEDQDGGGGLVDRTRKMAANIELALKKMIDSTSNDKIKKEIKTQCSHHKKHAVIHGDLSNYEQLVIMKKYPYLDLKEVEPNFHLPPSKVARQSFDSEQNYGEEPSFCECPNLGPKVEITNRGLTGFAIPMKLIKTENVDESKIDTTLLQDAIIDITKTSSTEPQPPDDSHLLESLEDDIQEFQKHLNR